MTRLPFPTHRGLWSVANEHGVINLVDIRYDKGGFFEGRFIWHSGEDYIFIDDILKAGFLQWKPIITDADREAIEKARLKKERKLNALFSTPKALARRAEMESEHDLGTPRIIPPPNGGTYWNPQSL